MALSEQTREALADLKRQERTLEAQMDALLDDYVQARERRKSVRSDIHRTLREGGGMAADYREWIG